MKHFDIDTIGSCPISRLAAESFLLLKQQCKKQILHAPKKPFIHVEHEAQKEVELLEHDIKHLEARLKQGYQLIKERLGTKKK